MKNKENTVAAVRALILIAFIVTLSVIINACAVTGELGKHYPFEIPYTVTSTSSGIVYDSVYPRFHQGSVYFQVSEDRMIFLSEYEMKPFE